MVIFREKKCILYTGKYGMTSSLSLLLGFTNKWEAQYMPHNFLLISVPDNHAHTSESESM